MASIQKVQEDQHSQSLIAAPGEVVDVSHISTVRCVYLSTEIHYRGNKRSVADSKFDTRLHPQRLVYCVEIEGKVIVFTAAPLVNNSESQESFAGGNLFLTRSADGAVTLTDPATGSSWHAQRMFWFAWYRFHTDTELIVP